MKSITNLFRVGPGPSSSHTIAPSCAAKAFKRFLTGNGKVTVTLYGSLAFTGSGHKTDNAIRKALLPFETEFVFRPLDPTEHPLKMVFEYGDIKHIYYSLGGGEIKSPTDPDVNEYEVYPFKDFDSIKKYMNENDISSFKEFCHRFESDDIDDKLMDILKAMFASVEYGVSVEGRVPTNDNPKLKYERCAKSIRDNALSIPEFEAKREMLITSYAYAVAENSASGIDVVTSPTCGSSGVLPGILYFGYKHMGISMETLRDSLFVAGMIGNCVKQNASIAGSVGGCQAEIGTASSMAAAALSFIVDPESIYQLEYAAECAMEHFLGLSCDPVDGYVVIPCIERNGMGALRSYDAFLYAKYISPLRKNQVSFDDVVSAMKITGDSLSDKYKETAQGGLAEILKKTDANC
ncbi:MAG: L-serine ammonia-lyase, iron-sulfur-dependent, subunit alpha [Bacilli bacterium]|nr:L-serine ammonia-lyase, iron-sulfur-dependent, subunit alpha [Bacilli bacterium]